ncbi:putative membrane copper amine oxidase [Thozetella sp. PMI_491]|nr:putative membrane copper amine oxidase [Thozetella sp. PMI_491]
MMSRTCLSLKGLVVSAVLLCSFAGESAARPSPRPKTTWGKHGQAHKGLKRMADDIKRSIEGKKLRREDETACPETLATAITAPKTNIWAGLTDIEAASIAQWLFAQTDLNLTVSENATDWDNSVVLIELLRPNKTDALAYIDSGSSTPTRYAHIVLDNRASEEPTYADIVVGPLPIDNTTTKWEPLTYPFTKKNNGRVRNLDADSDALYTDWLNVISTSVADITLDLWGAAAYGLENDTISVWGIDPSWQDNGRVVRWDTFWNVPTSEFDDSTLLPLGLYFKSDVTGRDVSQWKLEGWLYNDIFYETTDDFRAAYFAPGFEKLGTNEDGEWAQTDPLGDPLPFESIYPPTQIAPSGARYALDAEQKYIEWMGFSFYVGFTRDTGMGLYDIRYKGERILYELGLQEALAHYAGNDPVQSSTAYLDSYYGFGPYAFELVQGYDCPAYATYLNSTFYMDETTHTHINSICLFEYDADFPMQRHSASGYVAISKNVYFTIRSVSTVGNYDYMFSYTFALDGSITVEVRASGYIQSAYYAANGDYGFQIHDSLSGSMHDHVLNYKADFDILGTNNSVQLMKNIPASRQYSWSNGKNRKTMTLKRSFIDSEDDGKQNWDPFTQVLVVNEDQKNKFGENRGYRVLPYTGTARLTVEESSNLVNAARWAEHDFFVTRQHDTEPKSSHPFNNQDVFDPPVNFDQFFNSESLRQEDLVLWLNLGMHHVPHTGDLPNTVFTTAHSGIQFMPSNYFTGDTSHASVNRVRIEYGNGSAEVTSFGQQDSTCALTFEPVEPDLENYKGDVVVRKFPYDPSNPYFETDAIV